jgi:hypothetical protein
MMMSQGRANCGWRAFDVADQTEQLSPQDALRLIAGETVEQRRLLKSIRLHLVIVAIPFWIALCSVAFVVALYLFGALALVGSGG